MAERLQIEISVDDRGSPALRTFNAQLERTDKLSAAAAGGFTKLERSIITVAQGMEIAARAINLAARTFDTFIGQVVQRGEELQGLSRRLSVNVETLSKFDFAAKQAGVNLEGLGQGFRKLASSLVEAQQKGTAANRLLVDGLGFTIAQIKALEKDPTRAVLALAAAFNKYEDSARKTVGAQVLFARGAQSFLQFFKEGVPEIQKNIALAEKLGLTWRDTGTAAADRLGDAVTALFGAFEGLRNKLFGNEQALNGLAAALERAAGNFADFTRNLPEAEVEKLRENMFGLATAIIDVANVAIPAMTAALPGIVGQLAEVAREAERIGNILRLVMGGAAVGALAGSVIPGAGTFAGASVGALAGLGIGVVQNRFKPLIPVSSGAPAKSVPGSPFLRGGGIPTLDELIAGGAPAPGGGGPEFPFTPKGAGGKGEADKQARALEAYNDAIRKLRDELTLLQDPTQKVRIEQERQLAAITELAKAAGVKLTPEIIELTQALPRLEEETKAAEKAAKEHAKALEQGAKMSRDLTDRLEEMADPLAKTRHEFRDLREEAAKLPNAAELNPLIDQLERAAIATAQWGSVFDQLADVAASALEGIILGTRDAGDAFKALKQAAISELTQIVISVAKAGVISAVSGTTVAPQGAGAQLVSGLLFGGGGAGGGAGILGSLLSGGGNGGGGLAGLLNFGGGGGGGIANTPTFGGGTLLQRALGFGGGAAAGLGAFAAPTLSALNAAAAAAPLAIQVPTTIGPSLSGGFTAGASGGASGISGAVAGIGTLIALGLAAKGLIDTRSGIDQVTLGTGNAAKNRLTGLGAGIIAGTTIGGAAIGLAAGGPLGAIAGAGVGAATGAAIEQAIAKGVTKGISDSVRLGLNQQQLGKRIGQETGDDLVLNILTGYLNKYGGIAETLGPAFAPDIERIFAKVFRQVIGGPGGLDTNGVATSGFSGLKDLKGPAGQASRIIAQAFGAGGAAFGDEREGNFVSILLGGVRKRLNEEGGDAGQIIAETFASAFNGKFLNALSAIFSQRKGLRDADAKFAAEQFTLGAPLFGFDRQRIVDAALEGERVPGKPARRRSREAFGSAFQAAIQNPDDPLAFQRSVQSAFVGGAAEGFAKALAKSDLGIGFADIFAPDRDERKAVRRAARSGGAEAALATLTAQFEENIGEFVEAVNDPAYAKAIKTFTDGVFRMGILASVAAGDSLGARGLIEGRVATEVGNVRGVQQLGRDVRSRVALLRAGPGFAQSQAAIDELGRQRRDADTGLLRRFGGTFSQLSARGLGAAAGTDTADLIAGIGDFARLRLTELEAESALARQIRDYYRDVKNTFQQLREQVDVIRRGPRAVQDILTKRLADARGLEGQALFGTGEGRDQAIARLSGLLPEILQLNSQLNAPGSAANDAILTFVDRLSEKIGIDATTQESAAEARLLAAKKNAEQLGLTLGPILMQLEVASTNALLLKLDEVRAALGGDGAVATILHQVVAGLEVLTGKDLSAQQGGPVTGTGPWVGLPPVPKNPNATNASNAVGEVTNGTGGTLSFPTMIQVNRSDSVEEACEKVAKGLRARIPVIVNEVKKAMAS